MRTKADFRARAKMLRTQHADDPPASFLATAKQLPVFVDASAVAIYLRCGVEASTEDIIAYGHTNGKRIGVPVWTPETGVYTFCDLHRGDRLVPGRMNIREPADKRPADSTIYDIFLVPGLLFDTHGTRIGHGKGYYDRLLAKRHPRAVIAALAFDWQITTERLPYEPHDISMDVLITPTRVINCTTHLPLRTSCLRHDGESPSYD